MRILRAYLRPDVRWLAVVKADAYGHGADAVLSEALRQNAWGGAVAIPEEGAKLREMGFDCPILVLGRRGRGVRAHGCGLFPQSGRA